MTVSRLTLIAGVGIGGWLSGIISERYKLYQRPLDVLSGVQEDICRKPGLPIFGTVSAATPILPAITTQKGVSRVSEIMKYGFPSLDNIRSLDDYVLSYDRRNKVVHWVFEHMTKETIKRNEEVDRSKCDFHEDASIHKYFRSQNSDYKGSGFDRGHMAAAGNHRMSQAHCDQTFLLSNMAPQVGKGFNRDSWNRLEKHTRDLTKTFKNVKEPDGKTYVKYQVIGANNVAVPTHFFKVIVVESDAQKLEMEAYVMPNQVISDSTPLHVFQVPPESIERAAGLLFFDKLSRDNLIKINGRKTTFV